MKYSLFLLSLIFLLGTACKQPKAIVKEKAILSLGTEHLAAISAKHPDLDHKNDLNVFLNELQQNIETHVWSDIFTKCNKMHYREQAVKMKMKPPQYLAEMLGLNNVDNQLTPSNKITYVHLEQLSKVTYETLDYDGNWITVKGKVDLRDGTSRNLVIYVQVLNGKYELIGGLG